MKKIVTHPLMIKVYEVYKSCETEKHIKVADNFAKLAKKKMSRETKKVGNDVFDIIEDSNIILYMEKIKQQAIKDKEKENNYE